MLSSHIKSGFVVSDGKGVDNVEGDVALAGVVSMMFPPASIVADAPLAARVLVRPSGNFVVVPPSGKSVITVPSFQTVVREPSELVTDSSAFICAITGGVCAWAGSAENPFGVVLLDVGGHAGGAGFAVGSDEFEVSGPAKLPSVS
jgi:hypothetical protein